MVCGKGERNVAAEMMKTARRVKTDGRGTMPWHFRPTYRFRLPM